MDLQAQNTQSRCCPGVSQHCTGRHWFSISPAVSNTQSNRNSLAIFPVSGAIVLTKKVNNDSITALESPPCPQQLPTCLSLLVETIWFQALEND